MIYKTEDQFSKDWKSGTRHPAYFFYGSELYLIERWTAQIAGEAESDAFHLHRFDGKKLDLDTLYEAVESMPLMMGSGGKCVLIDDLDWKGMPASNQGKLTEILSDLPDDCTLIATAKTNFDPKLAGSKKLIALFDKAGCALELGSRGTQGQIQFLKSEAKKQGCAISTDLCRYILELCEPDMLSLRGEMHKICAYAGSGELERRHVDAVCIPRTEAKVFDLSKAILSGNTAKAMELLDNLFYLRESAVMILAVLSRAYVDLYRARIARDEGRSTADVTAQFGYRGREWLVRNAFSSSAGLSAAYLRHALESLYRCDKLLKSSPADDRVLLEQCVMELFLLRERHR